MPHELSQYNKVNILLPNNTKYCIELDQFEYYKSVNELEHQTENIIITLNDLNRSFIYETDAETGEITHKEPIIVNFAA